MKLAPRQLINDQANQTESASENCTNNSANNKQNNRLVKSCSDTPQPPYHGASRQFVSINDGGVVSGVGCRATSLGVTHNRITINRGVFLAKEPLNINRGWEVQRSESGSVFLDEHIQSFLNHFFKISFKERECLDCILANLLTAYGNQSQVLYSRMSGNNPYYRQTLKVVEYLEREGLVYNVIGRNNEFQGNQSWLIPTDKLKSLFDQARVRVALRKNAPMLEVRGKDKKPLSSRVQRRNPKAFREHSEAIQTYNRIWLDHEATLSGRILNPFMKRIFNYDLKHGGRFYDASHLSLSSDTRKQILIDKTPTVEPDFKAMHFAIIYASSGLQLDCDPYLVEGFDRQTIKLASLVLLNSEDLKRFAANVTKSGNPNVKESHRQYQQEYERFIMRSSKGLPCEQPHKPKSLQGFIEGMPDGVQGAELLEAIQRRHAPVAHMFGTDRIGLKLQNTDSRIMAKVITTLAKHDIPVLPVHDSVRCRELDLEAVCKAMRDAFLSEAGFPCTIDH
jgi:hypothetical protein